MGGAKERAKKEKTAKERNGKERGRKNEKKSKETRAKAKERRDKAAKKEHRAKGAEKKSKELKSKERSSKERTNKERSHKSERAAKEKQSKAQERTRKKKAKKPKPAKKQPVKECKPEKVKGQQFYSWSGKYCYHIVAGSVLEQGRWHGAKRSLCNKKGFKKSVTIGRGKGISSNYKNGDSKSCPGGKKRSASLKIMRSSSAKYSSARVSEPKTCHYAIVITVPSCKRRL